MKKNLLFLSLCLLGLISVVSSCKKSTPKSKKELLSRAWKVQKAEHNGTVVFTANANNNTVSYSTYSLKFDATNFTIIDRQTVASSGTWTFGANESTINFSVPSNTKFNPATVSVLTLTESELVIQYTEPNSKGQDTDVKVYLVPAG